jgi:CRISPR-associated protein Csh1
MLFELSDMMSNAENPERIILDRHQMKNGLYVRIDREGNIKDNLIVNKETSTIGNTYWWFRDRDYYSSLLEMNKSVDTKKKIHSNNMYTIFIKCQNLPEVGEDKQLNYNQLEEIFDGYYDRINREYDKREKEILEIANIEVINIDDLEFCKNIMLKAIRETIKFIKNLDKNSGFTSKNDYVKLFIESDTNEDVDIKNYIKESNRYIDLKIFNCNDYNKNIKGKIYGLSNENMVLNNKKPYLELKSTKFKVPFKISLEQAIKNHKIIQWIENARDENGKIISNFNLNWDNDLSSKPDDNCDVGICFETIKTKTGCQIIENDFIPRNIKNLNKYFEYKNYLDYDKDEMAGCKERYVLEGYVDKVFFKNQMKIVYYNDEYKPKGLNTYCSNAMTIMKIPMKNYFRLGIEDSLNSVIDKITLGIIESSLNDENVTKYSIACKENLRLNLLRYFEIGGKKNMGDILTKVMEDVKTKVKAKEFIPIGSDDEFYYCIGQLTYYLCSLSEAKSKNQNMYNSIIKAQSSKKIKDILKHLYKVYNYKIGNANLKFNNLFSMIMGYEPTKKSNVDMIICGLTTNNVIYTKKEEE